MRWRLAAFADEADGTLTGQIKAMKENGVSLLEIRGVDGQNIADISAKKAKEIKERLDAEGLAVWSLGSPYGKIGIEEPFGPHLDSFKQGVELAQILGAKHIRLFSFYVPDKDPQAYRERVMKRLEQFVAAVKGSDLVLCHENEKGIFGDKADRCLQIHKEFPEVKAVFDPANFIQCGQDTQAAWEMLHPYVEYLHIKDALPNGNVVPAGKGIGNLPYLLQHYTGEVLTVEPHLSVFEGFQKLEKETAKKPEYCYASQEEAFAAAVKALKDTIDDTEQKNNN